MMLTDEKRADLIVMHRHHQEQARQIREVLEVARTEWASEERPGFAEWLAFVGDDPDHWASGQLMAWMNETGRKMG